MSTRNHRIRVVTIADQSGVGYSAYLSGYIQSIRYAKTDYANGVDFDVTVESSGEDVWNEDNVNASTIRYPRAPTHTQLGAASLYAAAGTAVNGRIAIARDRIKVSIAAGGAAGKIGDFIVTVADE
jgi:hypothetical protein